MSAPCLPRLISCLFLMAFCPGLRSATPDSPIDIPALIQQAITDNKGYVRIPPGIHRVSRQIALENVHDFVIDGRDATLLFTKLNNGGVGLTGCKNVILRGFTIDFDPLPFIQGTVTAISEDRSTLDFELHKGYGDVKALELFAETEKCAFRPWLYNGKDRLRKDVAWYHNTPVTYLENGKYRIRNCDSEVKAELGDLLALYARGGACATGLMACENVIWDHVTILTAPLCAITCHLNQGGIRLNHMVITRGPKPAGATEDRLISTIADAFYVRGGRGPIIEDSEIAFQGDDYFNFHGDYYPVVAVESPNSILTAFAKVGHPQPIMNARPGDSVRFLTPGSGSILGRTTIRSIEKVADTQWDAKAQSALGALWGGEAYGGKKEMTGPVEVFRVTFSTPFKDVGTNMYFDIPTENGSGFVVRNSYFHDGRGMFRISATCGIVEGNRFERGGDYGLAITMNPPNIYPESGWAENIVIRNNTFSDFPRNVNWRALNSPIAIFQLFSASGEPQSSYKGVPDLQGHRNIWIENNTFIGYPEKIAISVAAARDVFITGNRFSRNGLPESDKTINGKDNELVKKLIFIHPTSSNVVIEDNQLISPETSKQPETRGNK